MKIRLVQMDSIVGGFDYNLKKMREALHRASSDELVVFPECCICGYPAQDLLDYPGFAERSEKESKALIREFSDKSFVFGSVEKNKQSGKPYRNVAYFVEKGELKLTYFKRLLPTYDVFDEDRFFEPGREKGLVSFQGKQIGLSICEDIWNHDVGANLQNRYSQDPLGEMKDQVDLFINLSASPFESAKVGKKKAMLQSIVRKYKVPLVYANAVGANDNLIFDGRSYLLASDGDFAMEAKPFEEDEQVFDAFLEASTHKNLPERTEIEELYDALVLGIRDYCRKSGFSKALLGLSGGIDSAVVACLAIDALGAENVTLIMMPSRYTSQASNEDAFYVAKQTQCPLHIMVIEELFSSALKTLGMAFQNLEEDVTEENLQSRIRGLLTMALSNKFGGLVLTTGNKSELAVGYCTLYGDMNGGLAPLSDVYKTQVYELGREANRRKARIPERMFTKPASAELRANQTDQDHLPPYEELDPLLKKMIEDFRSPHELIEEGHDKERVEAIFKLLRQSEFKRYQMPLGLKVSSKAFGLGRRVPLVHSYY